MRRHHPFSQDAGSRLVQAARQRSPLPTGPLQTCCEPLSAFCEEVPGCPSRGRRTTDLSVGDHTGLFLVLHKQSGTPGLAAATLTASRAAQVCFPVRGPASPVWMGPGTPVLSRNVYKCCCIWCSSVPPSVLPMGSQGAGALSPGTLGVLAAWVGPAPSPGRTPWDVYSACLPAALALSVQLCSSLGHSPDLRATGPQGPGCCCSDRPGPLAWDSWPRVLPILGIREPTLLSSAGNPLAQPPQCRPHGLT